jgi:hypothetical protein
MLFSINEYLNKGEYEKKRTPSELNKWVQELNSLIKGMEKNERYKLLEGGLGKKFIREVIPLNHFVQHDFSDRTDIWVEPLSGNESADARIYQKEGKELLYEVQITEAIDGDKWALQKELLLGDKGCAPETGVVRRVKMQKGKNEIESKSGWRRHSDIVKDELKNICHSLEKKLDCITYCDTKTVLLLYFDDGIVFRPDDEQTAKERILLTTEVSKLIHSKKPNIDKLVLVGRGGKSFYEFPINKQP